MILNLGGAVAAGSGSGASLNFKVVGGTSAPSNPSENTIWVNTSTAITSWIFSVTQPDTPEEGMVWIQTSTSSPVEFNALKSNGIIVYPLLVKQYVSGAWVDVDAKSYHAGAWVDWVIWLYNLGAFYEDFTGGLATNLVKYSSSVTGTKAPAITYNDDNVHIEQTGSTTVPVGSVVYFSKKIDLSGYKTLHFDGILNDTAGGNPQRSFLGIWSDFGTYRDTNRVAYLGADNADCEKTLDISGLDDGEYYIGFYLMSPDIYKQSYVTMRRMWLE